MKKILLLAILCSLSVSSFAKTLEYQCISRESKKTSQLEIRRSKWFGNKITFINSYQDEIEFSINMQSIQGPEELDKGEYLMTTKGAVINDIFGFGGSGLILSKSIYEGRETKGVIANISLKQNGVYEIDDILDCNLDN